jgi:hypothetical protein
MKAEVIKIEHVRIKLGKRTLELTVEEAKELRDVLNDAFPEAQRSEPVTVPVPYPVPIPKKPFDEGDSPWLPKPWRRKPLPWEVDRLDWLRVDMSGRPQCKTLSITAKRGEV